jgi:hypothetical protein
VEKRGDRREKWRKEEEERDVEVKRYILGWKILSC